MKNIKEYINESLFDDEDDLLDKNPDQVIFDYLKSIVLSHQVKYVDEEFYIKNGIIYYRGSDQFTFTIESPMPSYINFDKKSCGDNIISLLSYNGISQEDLDRLPGGVWLIKSNRLSKLTIPIYKALDLQEVNIFNNVILKPVEEYTNIAITIGKRKQNKLTPKDIMNLSVQGKDPEVCLRIINQNDYNDIKNMLLSDPDFSKHVIKDLHCSVIVGNYGGREKYFLEYLDMSDNITDVISKGQWRERCEI